jgi:hypothetical protein
MSDFLKQQIQNTKDTIEAINGAVLALASNDVQSYTLNTGQGTQSVTKKDLKRLNDTVDSLLNRLVTLEARCYGGGSVQVVPAC